MAVLLTPTHPLQQVLHFGTKGNDVCSVTCICTAVQKHTTLRTYTDKNTHITPQMPLNLFFVFLKTESYVHVLSSLQKKPAV